MCIFRARVYVFRAVHTQHGSARETVFLYTMWACFALAEFVSVKNRHRVPEQYRSLVVGGRGAEGVGRVTAVRIFIAVEENDYCNMYYQVSRLRPSGGSYEKELSDERAHNIKKNIILAKGLLREGGQCVNL